MAEFFSMDGYGGYIWPAYVLSVVILAGFVLVSLRSYRHAQKRVADLEANTSKAATTQG